MLVLVTYDVCLDTQDGQKRLRRVAKVCTNYGVRVQNSVFECVVDQAQYVMLKNKIRKEIDEEKDSVRFYRLGNSYTEKVEFFGKNTTLQVEQPLIL